MNILKNDQLNFTSLLIVINLVPVKTQNHSNSLPHLITKQRKQNPYDIETPTITSDVAHVPTADTFRKPHMATSFRKLSVLFAAISIGNIGDFRKVLVGSVCGDFFLKFSQLNPVQVIVCFQKI